jgi:ATP-dependent DNA helicase DinG
MTSEYPDSISLLGKDGPFASLLDGYQPRDSQQQMSARIEQAIDKNETLIAESGTGTGKTLAYLVPALKSGKRIIISTGTRHLQDQLYQHDLPLVRKALEIPATMAILKGRSNYLCRQRLDMARSGNMPRGSYPARDLNRVAQWAIMTRSGDISEVTGVPEQSMVWPDVTSTPDNCLGSKCDDYDRCHVNAARKDALDADVLVVNHHLFLADLVLREEGFGQLLPGVDVVIFDEAHQLPETASMFFSSVVSQHQLLELCRDVRIAESTEKSGISELERLVDICETRARECRLAMGVEVRRGSWSELQQDRAFASALAALKEDIGSLSEILQQAAACGERLAQCSDRARLMIDRLKQQTDEDMESVVRWFETSRTGFRLHATPLNVADRFRELIHEGERSFIMTSATLAVADKFTHFQRQLGLEEAQTGIWASPFNYAEQGLFYLPEDLPMPNQRLHTERVVEEARKVLEITAGRAFLLFTSFQALNEAARLLEGELDYPLLIQGEQPRQALLQAFREAGNAVLLGTGSFWEGVDVKGQALSAVIIDKLPFAAPDDPVLQARSRLMKENGQNPFMQHQLPQAVVALRQGAGRLIRDINDRGLLMVCDPRLADKPYGRLFVKSLPPMTRTRKLEDVEAFFAAASPDTPAQASE